MYGGRYLLASFFLRDTVDIIGGMWLNVVNC
jgi:hypothetical protein